MPKAPDSEPNPPHDPALDPEDERHEVLRLELERRLRIFDELDDDAFGRFTRFDWWLCTLLFFLLPLLIVWWAA